MISYNLPEFKLPELKPNKTEFLKSPEPKKRAVLGLVLIILISSFFGFFAGVLSSNYFYQEVIELFDKLNLQINRPQAGFQTKNNYTPQTTQEEAVINVVKKASPSVVSIIISKDLPVYEEYYYSPFEEFFGQPFFEFKIPQYRQKGFEKRQVGGGTGFIISEDGMVLTNKHVVLDEEAEYTILTVDGDKYPAKVLARDPVQDIAILKIKQKEGDEEKSFPKIQLGDSDKIQIGQTVIAIGYALGKYQNTVSVGVVAGLGRTITASGGGFYEVLEDIIQTDAAINKGNSGGPLLNLKGEVIGINTAIDVQGQNIGFAVPINKAKRDIQQVKTTGKIVYPFLGVRYVLINEDVKKEYNLPVDYGALIIGGNGEPAIFEGSAAEKAGLKEKDIILEFNGEKITQKNSLAKIIMKYNPGDEVSLKILRGEEEKIVNVVLGERSE